MCDRVHASAPKSSFSFDVAGIELVAPERQVGMSGHRRGDTVKHRRAQVVGVERVAYLVCELIALSLQT